MRADRYHLFWEPLDLMRDDGLDDMIAAHHAEVGVHKEDMPLACDWEKYEALEYQGILRLLGARFDGQLVGYASFLVMPHLHYRTTVHAMNDAIFVRPEHRRTGLALELVRKPERDFVKEFKKVRFWYHDKAGLRLLAPVLERCGYSQVETGWDKMARES